MLLSYVNIGLAEIAGYKPDAFTTTTFIILATGAYQSIDDHVRLISADANEDGTSIHESDLDLLRGFSAYADSVFPIEFTRQGKPIYQVKSYAIDPKNPVTFYVSPPVPAGITPKIRVTVQDVAPEYTDSMLDYEIPLESKYFPNLWDYVMARAYEVDRESKESQNNSKTHMALFLQAMGVKIRRESQFRTGFTNGQIGEGDSRVGAG
jgi:hypothetical protein